MREKEKPTNIIDSFEKINKLLIAIEQFLSSLQRIIFVWFSSNLLLKGLSSNR